MPRILIMISLKKECVDVIHIVQYFDRNEREIVFNKKTIHFEKK